MGATFSRIKNWTTEILSDTDLNAEIDNILNNLTPSGVDDYSATAAQMKLTVNPGSTGSESLATSMAGELERLRYVIKGIIGTGVTNWYDAPASSLTDLIAVLGSGSGLPPNRIASGKTTGSSSQLNVLIPSNVSASLTLTASSVDPFSYYINGTVFTVTASTTLNGLSLAVAANASVSINKPDMTGSKQYSKSLGQYGTSIFVDGMNSSPAALVGNIVAFQATGSSTEYFLGYLESTVAITNAWRGCFFNQTPSAMLPVPLNDNDVLRLQKLAWIFINTSSSLAVTYSNPSVSGAQPSGPAIGDYWFDLASTAWKTYNGTSWNAANATLVGLSVQDTVACVAARTLDSYKVTADLQNLSFSTVSSNIAVKTNNMFGKVSVFGRTLEFGTTRPAWDITLNLKSGETESINTTYYMYMDENGSAMMTNIAPMIRADLNGLYYPTETWRCVGSVRNDSSTNMTSPIRTFRSMAFDRILVTDIDAYRTGSTNGTADRNFPVNFNSSYIKSNYDTLIVDDGATSVVVSSLTLEPGFWGLVANMQVNITTDVTTASLVYGGITDNTAAGVAYADSPGFSSYIIAIPVNASNIHARRFGGSVPFLPVMVTAQTTYKLWAKNSTGSTVGTPTMVAHFMARRLDKLGDDQ